MIVLDTSAFFAVLQGERDSDRVKRRIAEGGPFLISAGTLSEANIVAVGRRLTERFDAMFAMMEVEVHAVDAAMATGVRTAFVLWGKGQHPARLNFGDCFAYALARSRDLPLLYVGDDFARTDVRSAL